METETIASLAFGLTVLAFLWNLHRDMGILRKDLGQEISNVRKALGEDISDLRDRVLRVEDRVARVEDRVAGVENRVARVEGMLAGAGLKVAPEPASG